MQMQQMLSQSLTEVSLMVAPSQFKKLDLAKTLVNSNGFIVKPRSIAGLYCIKYNQCMDDQKNILLTWTTPEHIHRERSIDFYWALGLITLAASVLAFILRDGLFGALLLIGGGLYGYISWKKPSDITTIISDKDITIGDDVYPIAKIKAFRVMDIKGEKELVLQIAQTYQPIISTCVPEDIAYPLRDLLRDMLFEDETLLPHVGRRFMARYKI